MHACMHACMRCRRLSFRFCWRRCNIRASRLRLGLPLYVNLLCLVFLSLLYRISKLLTDGNPKEGWRRLFGLPVGLSRRALHACVHAVHAFVYGLYVCVHLYAYQHAVTCVHPCRPFLHACIFFSLSLYDICIYACVHLTGAAFDFLCFVWRLGALGAHDVPAVHALGSPPGSWLFVFFFWNKEFV